jgi:hypothetical protein
MTDEDIKVFDKEIWKRNDGYFFVSSTKTHFLSRGTVVVGFL